MDINADFVNSFSLCYLYKLHKKDCLNLCKTLYFSLILCYNVGTTKRKGACINMQANTITNETMHEIIQALLGKYPASASIQPEQAKPAAQPPKYRPTVKLKTELSRKTMSIAYSDICFVSTSAKAIHLPYIGELPDDLLAQIYTTAVEDFTIRELNGLAKKNRLEFQDVVSNIAVTLHLHPSRRQPLIALSMEVTTTNGHSFSRYAKGEMNQRQLSELLNRFFNRKKTGLRADICAQLEQQHVEYIFDE